MNKFNINYIYIFFTLFYWIKYDLLFLIKLNLAEKIVTILYKLIFLNFQDATGQQRGRPAEDDCRGIGLSFGAETKTK